MENCEDIKIEIGIEEIQTTFTDSAIVKCEKVQSDIKHFDDEKCDGPPRRNGLFSITGNLKVHRNFADGT